MFRSSVFSWSDQRPSLAPRTEEELVTDTLTLELRLQLKRAERQRRDRQAECKRARQGVDYTWLTAQPRPAYQPPTVEQLELEGLCCKIKPSQCGPVILRFRKLLQEFDPAVHEVPRIFRSIVLDFIEQEEEEDVQRILRNQLESQRRNSISFLTLTSRLRTNTFHHGESVQVAVPGPMAARRARSMPEFDLQENY